jgi:hypothetical protein
MLFVIFVFGLRSGRTLNARSRANLAEMSV